MEKYVAVLSFSQEAELRKIVGRWGLFGISMEEE